MTVQDTSRTAYADLIDSLPRRERLVWDALVKCSTPPTAYELMQQMKEAGEAFDVNSVRPRLTALLAKGCVRKIDTRMCRVTGTRACTWQVVAEHPPAEPSDAKPHDLNAAVPGDGRLW